MLRINRLSEEQLEDIRSRLDHADISFTEDRPTLPIDQFLYVAEGQANRARLLIRKEFKDFAQQRRERAKEEWKTKYGGSYWRWLVQRLTTKPKEVLFRLFNLL